jgi:hypothetical protein
VVAPMNDIWNDPRPCLPYLGRLATLRGKCGADFLGYIALNSGQSPFVCVIHGSIKAEKFQ